MKFFLCLFALAMSVAAANAVEGAIELDEPDEALQVRDLKGSGGSKGSKGASGSSDKICTEKKKKCVGPQFCSDGCQKLKLYVKPQDLLNNVRNSTIQFNRVPFYQKGCKGPVGEAVVSGNALAGGRAVFTFNKNTAFNVAGLLASKLLPFDVPFKIPGSNIIPIVGGTGACKFCLVVA